MSKKNSLKIRARQHAFDLRREQAEKERQQKLAEKRERKVERQVAAGAIKKKKSKGIRIRKGVKIRGIKVVDADSKQKVLQVLKAEQAMQQMEVEGEPAAAGLKKAKKKVKVAKIKRKGARSDDPSSGKTRQKPVAAAAPGSGDGVAAMQLA